jgi:hypothetical protein
MWTARPEPLSTVPFARPPGRRLGIPEVYAGIALLSFLVARFVPVLEVHVPCPFLATTGHPCGTCGMTHAFVYLAHGQLAQAFRWSPLGALLAASAWGYAVADLVRVSAGWPWPAIPPRLARHGAIAGAVALLANWAYLLTRGLGA